MATCTILNLAVFSKHCALLYRIVYWSLSLFTEYLSIWLWFSAWYKDWEPC